MLAGLSRRGVAALVALCLALPLVATLGSASTPAATPAAATPDSPAPALLDLPWLMLAPSDIPDPGYRHWSGGFEALAAYSRLLARDDANPADYAKAIAGWRQSYATWLSLPSEEDPDITARFIHVRLTQFRDDASAEAAFAARQAALERLGYEAGAKPPPLGDQTAMLRGRLTETNSKRSYVALFALARFADLTVEVDIRDYANDAPPTSLATALLSQIADRVPAVRAGATPRFSLRLPRVPLWRLDRDRYLRRDNTPIRGSAQALTSFRSEDAFARDNAISDWYAYNASRDNADPSFAARIGITIVLLQFPDDAAAEAYLRRAPDDWQRQLGARAADVVPLAPPAAAGADAALFTFPGDTPGPVTVAYQGWLRDGDVVARMALTGLPTRADAAMRLALTRLAGCLQFSCTDLADLDAALAQTSAAATPATPTGALATPSSAPAATPRASAPTLVDLGWVALVPGDLGQPGYGLSAGTALTADDYTANLGGDAAARARLAQALTQLGWRQAYQDSVARPSQEDPDYFDRAVAASSIQFADAAAAGQAMDLLGQALDERGWDRSPIAVTLGDQAFIARRQVVGPQTGRPGEEARLLVQDGAFVLDLTIADYTNDAPAASEMIRSLTLVQERLRAARTGATPNLSLMLRRLALVNPDDRSEVYIRRDGVQAPRYRQSEPSLRASDARNGDLGMRDIYIYRTTWRAPGAPTAASITYNVTIARFDTADNAAAFVESAAWRLAGSPGISEVKTVATAPQWGDGSVTVSYVADLPGRGATPAYATAIQVGDRIAAIDVFGAGISLAAFERLAQGQAACLQGGDCWTATTSPPQRGPVPVPATPVPAAPANIA